MTKTYFQGESMTCIVCRQQITSHTQIESQWTALEVDGHRFDVCPRCFGTGQHKSIQRRKLRRVFRKVARLLKEQRNG